MIGATAPSSGLLSHHSATNTRQAPFPAGRHRTPGRDQPAPESAVRHSAGARTGRRSWSSLAASPASRDVSSSPRSNAGRAGTGDTRRACSGYERGCARTRRLLAISHAAELANRTRVRSCADTRTSIIVLELAARAGPPPGERLNHRRPDRPALPMPSGAGSSPPWTRR